MPTEVSPGRDEALGKTSAAAESKLPPETEVERIARIKNYGDIPRTKLAQVQRILKDYQELENKLFEERSRDQGYRLENPVILGKDHSVRLTVSREELRERETRAGREMWAALQLLGRERRADLRTVLTPEEADECDMRFSPQGRNLLVSLGNIETSRAERGALYGYVNDFAVEHGMNVAFTPVEAGVREEARLVMYDRMRDVLGEERFTAYLATEEMTYQRLAAIAMRQHGSPAVGEQLWRMRSEMLIRIGELHRAAGAGNKPVAEAIAAVRNDIRDRALALVGEPAIKGNPAAFEWLPRQ